MRRIAFVLSLILLMQLAGPAVCADNAAGATAPDATAAAPEAVPSDELKQELEKLKKAVAALEERLKSQEKQTQAPAQALVPQQPGSGSWILKPKRSNSSRSAEADRTDFWWQWVWRIACLAGAPGAAGDDVIFSSFPRV